MIKAVFVDLDGTLLDDEKQISKENIDAIKQFQKNGGIFVVNTGRGYATSSKFLKEAGIECDYICLSGAAIYTFDGECLMSDVLEEQEINVVRELEKKYGFYVNYLTSKGIFSQSSYENAVENYRKEAFMMAEDAGVVLEDNKDILKKYENILKCVHYDTDIDKLITSDIQIYKMVVMGMNVELLEKAKKEMNSYPSLVAVSPYKSNFEVNSTRVHKGQATLAYAKEKGLTMEEIMVIGDSDNDIPMLELSFGKTIAMANANETIKSISSDVTLSNNDNGVAYAIKKWALK